MAKNCAFTICTRSYIGLAKALKESFMKYNEDFDFFIIFSDLDSNESDDLLSGCEIIGLGKEKYEELAFKYNVTEFCTCIKPFGFTFFFNKGYETVAYFDPDIMFFSRFNELYENYSVFLTPHILNPTSMKNDWGQEKFLKYGVYNCGFVGLRNDEDGRFVAEWWGNQLLFKAFSDSAGGMYTDQKWMDMVPSFISLSKICVIKNWGCDFAPWNYSERTIDKQYDIYYAVNRDNIAIKDKLVFVHYSAYNYKKLLTDGTIESKYRMSSYPEMDALIREYEIALNKCDTLEKLSISYKYNNFDNGLPVLAFHRRLYRRLIEDGVIINNPFSTAKDSFFALLQKSKLISKTTKSQVKQTEIKNYEGKSRMLEKICKKLFAVLGVDKYVLLLRKIEHMSRFEENVFLLKK